MENATVTTVTVLRRLDSAGWIQSAYSVGKVRRKRMENASVNLTQTQNSLSILIAGGTRVPGTVKVRSSRMKNARINYRKGR